VANLAERPQRVSSVTRIMSTLRACANARTFLVRRAPALPRRQFPSRPRRLCSQPSWRRRVGPVPGGHRFGRRLIPGNKAAQPVPIEPFVLKTPENGIFVWQNVGPFRPHFNRDKYATSRTAHRLTAAQPPSSGERFLPDVRARLKVEDAWSDRNCPCKCVLSSL
jgi:hypothetical protein